MSKITRASVVAQATAAAAMNENPAEVIAGKDIKHPGGLYMNSRGKFIKVTRPSGEEDFIVTDSGGYQSVAVATQEQNHSDGTVTSVRQSTRK